MDGTPNTGFAQWGGVGCSGDWTDGALDPRFCDMRLGAGRRAKRRETSGPGQMSDHITDQMTGPGGTSSRATVSRCTATRRAEEWWWGREAGRRRRTHGRSGPCVHAGGIALLGDCGAEDRGARGQGRFRNDCRGRSGAAGERVGWQHGGCRGLGGRGGVDGQACGLAGTDLVPEDLGGDERVPYLPMRE